MTREELQKNAIEIIRDEGFDKLTLSKLAKASNLSKATLYHYFDSKDALIESLYDHFSTQIGELGISISFSENVETIIKKTYMHWKKVYSSDKYAPYISLILQRRDIEDRAYELSQSLTLMITAQSDAIIENLLSRYKCLIKDKELLSELFSSTSLYLLEREEAEEPFLTKFSSLFT